MRLAKLWSARAFTAGLLRRSFRRAKEVASKDVGRTQCSALHNTVLLPDSASAAAHLQGRRRRRCNGRAPFQDTALDSVATVGCSWNCVLAAAGRVLGKIHISVFVNGFAESNDTLWKSTAQHNAINIAHFARWRRFRDPSRWEGCRDGEGCVEMGGVSSAAAVSWWSNEMTSDDGCSYRFHHVIVTSERKLTLEKATVGDCCNIFLNDRITVQLQQPWWRL